MKNTAQNSQNQHHFNLKYAAISALSPYLLAATALLLFKGLGG